MKLREHQAEVLPKLRNGVVLAGGVGSGKTIASLADYVLRVCGGSLDRSTPMSKPTNLLVLTTAKKRDKFEWESDMKHFGLFREPENTYGGVEIIIDSWQNIKKYGHLQGWHILCDEQRLVGSGAWVKTFLKLAKTNSWMMLSATPADNWIDYVPLFVANGFYRNRTEFLEEHVVWQMMGGKYRKIRGYYGVKKLRKLRDQILVEMPFDRHTTRHVEIVEVDYDKEMFDRVWKRRWNVYDDCPLIDAAEMHRLGRRVVNENDRRLDAIVELAEKHPRMIIFYNFNYELEMLRTLHGKLDIPVAEWNGHRHEEVPETERWLYLVQYTAGAEGWNCITTDTIVYYSLNYSHKVFEQSQGRIDRLNTPYFDLWYYVLMTSAKIDKIIWNSVKNKKTFHESSIKF